MQVTVPPYKYLYLYIHHTMGAHRTSSRILFYCSGDSRVVTKRISAIENYRKGLHILRLKALYIYIAMVIDLWQQAGHPQNLLS
jgi:hypothetical protein